MVTPSVAACQAQPTRRHLHPATPPMASGCSLDTAGGSRPNSMKRTDFGRDAPHIHQGRPSDPRGPRSCRPRPSPSPSEPEPPARVETDPRFPSGPWRGFFLMEHWPGRHQMELHLTFRQGVMTGEGRDRIGDFLIRGKYNLDDGKCHWTKRVHRQARRGLSGLQRGQGHLGPLGDPSVLAGRIPHLADGDGRPDVSPPGRGASTNRRSPRPNRRRHPRPRWASGSASAWPSLNPRACPAVRGQPADPPSR